MKKHYAISIIFWLLITTNTFAQVVEIPDPNLENSIREALELPPATPITQQQMLRLKVLNAGQRSITNLTGLEHATNLYHLIAHQNQIHDLTPLAELLQIHDIFIWGNPISDISPLANLTQLHFLDLGGCRVSDITPLANLTKLESLNLRGNYIEDITVLANLINLKLLRINDNPILDYSPLDGLSLNLLEQDEICELPYIPIQDRIQNRTFPSVFSAWSHRTFNVPAEISLVKRLSLYDLHWNSTFHHSFIETNQGWKLNINTKDAIATREAILDFNPNIIFITTIQMRDAFDEDSPYWLRDTDGNRIHIAPEDPEDPPGFLLDFTDPDMQDTIVGQAIAVANCGLYDGIFFDWWKEHHAVLANGYEIGWREGYYSLETELQARDNILSRIRAAVRDDFLIIGNAGYAKIPRTAWGINGIFMETQEAPKRGYTHKYLINIENTLLWAEQNLRSPQINCVEGGGFATEPPDSPNNRHWMRLFTTMTLTLSDGYVKYNLGRTTDLYAYSFWNTDLGRPVGVTAQQYKNINGLFIREFTNGWAVYNRSGEAQTISLPQFTTGVSSRKSRATHLLPDLDGEIYLRTGKPFDLNRDGTINVLDLILVSQHFGTTDGDINGDGTTNILDLTVIARQFSQ